MLDWISIILSGAGLVMQSRSDKPKQSEYLIETLRTCSSYLSFSKDIHNFTQDVYYKYLENYITHFGGEAVDINKKNWKNIYDIYEEKLKDYNLDVSLYNNSKKNSAFNGNKKQDLDKVAKKLRIENSVEVLNHSYPEMVKKTINFNDLMRNYNRQYIIHGTLDESEHTRIKNSVKNAMYEADRSIKQLIVIFEQIMSNT